MGPKNFDVSMLGLDTFYHKDGSWKNLAQDSQSSLAPGYIYIYIHIFALGILKTKLSVIYMFRKNHRGTEVLAFLIPQDFCTFFWTSLQGVFFGLHKMEKFRLPP